MLLMCIAAALGVCRTVFLGIAHQHIFVDQAANGTNTTVKTGLRLRVKVALS